MKRDIDCVKFAEKRVKCVDLAKSGVVWVKSGVDCLKFGVERVKCVD